MTTDTQTNRFLFIYLFICSFQRQSTYIYNVTSQPDNKAQINEH